MVRSVISQVNPISRFSRSGGKLSPGSVPIDRIIAKTGTPLYIYDANLMRQQYNRLVKALPRSFTICYSMKANPNPAVAKIFRKLGAGAEIASKAELEAALAGGFKPRDIIYAGPGKTEDELKDAMRSRIGVINVESETELERISKLSRRINKNRKRAKTKIALRVNPDFTSGNKGEVMIGGSRKFGIDSETIEPLILKTMADPGLDLAGFHFYAGTGLLEAKTLIQAYKAFVRWMKKTSVRLKLDVGVINFGGGLGIPYADGENELDIKAVGAALKKITANLAKSPGFKKTGFILEPGRYLAGPSGVYISEVTDIKRSRGTLYVITNGGINHSLIPIVLNRNYPTAILNKMNRRKKIECVVAGPLCASPDQFSRKVKLPKPEIGDLLGVFNSGAYGLTASMLEFLSHPTPAEVLTDQGRAYLIRESRKPEFGGFKRLKI